MSVSGADVLNARVRHVLADGRTVDDITGFVVPNSGTTAAVYRIAEELVLKQGGVYDNRRKEGC